MSRKVDDYPLSKEEFQTIYSKVPRLCVEIVVINHEGRLYLTKRAIEPCKGQWHLPGGTVRFGESLLDAVWRISRRELGIKMRSAHSVGHIEYPSHYLHGLDCPLGIVFEIIDYDGSCNPNDEATQGDWFDHMPQPMHGDQDVYLLHHDYIKR